MAGTSGEPLILFVEDNETIRSAFSVLLEESGYRVALAASGEEAIRLAEDRRPALILMDLGLPDINGLEATRRLKANPATQAIPVVALTGRALASDAEACFDAGCTAYFSKPVDTRELMRTIPELIAS
jgi:two-component system, cell cycle response regulator DivK